MHDTFFSPKCSKYGRNFSRRKLWCVQYFSSIFWRLGWEAIQRPSVLGQLVFGGSSALELAVLRNDDLIFQWISLSYATLLLIVFFACGVNKLNYIKNDFVYIINQIYQYGFFPGWLHTIWKSRIKTKIILSKANFFIRKIARADQTKILCLQRNAASKEPK